MVIDLSSRDRKALVLTPIVKEFYKSDDSKYERFIETLHNTLCESSGHITIQPNNYTRGSCKFKKSKIRGLGL